MRRVDWTPTFERIAAAALDQGERVGHARAMELGAPAFRGSPALVEPRFTVAFVRWVFESGWRRQAVAPDALVPRLAALLGMCDSDWDLPGASVEPEWRPILERFRRDAEPVHPGLGLVALAWADISAARKAAGQE